MIEMTLVERIKQLCKERGITFVQFERDSGLGEHSVYRWDTNSPSIIKVKQAAHYFGITVSELLGEEIPASISADGLDGVNLLSPALLEELSRFVRLAKANPERALRFLAFANQEIESQL